MITTLHLTPRPQIQSFPYGYEDMVQRFDGVMQMLSSLKGFFKPTKIDTTIL